MSNRLAIYVAVVCAAAALVWVALPPDFESPYLLHYVAWILVGILAGALWLPTISGEATDSMASTADFTVLILWGVVPALYIVPIGTFLLYSVILRRQFIHSLYNSLAMVLVMGAAGYVWTLLQGPPDGLLAALGRGEFTTWGERLALVVPILAFGLAYRAVNITLTAIPVSWSSGRPIGEVLRQDFLYGEQIISDMALLFLSPLMVVSFLAINYFGVLLFYVPLAVIRDSHRRYVELRQAQDALIHTERMAAKGEMAAEIGHELANYLAAISGRSQMLVLEATQAANEKLERHARMILEQVGHMTILARGLMDYSSPEIRIQRVDVNDLINRTVEFVRPQNKFDGVEFEIALAEELPVISADPGQVQQVFLNLLSNAADAMTEKSVTKKLIRLASTPSGDGGFVEVSISDTGPGMSHVVLQRIFEPSFTTKPGGHGFGLSTSYRIVHLHNGTIDAESEIGRGATFRVRLPVSGQAAA